MLRFFEKKNLFWCHIHSFSGQTSSKCCFFNTLTILSGVKTPPNTQRRRQKHGFRRPRGRSSRHLRSFSRSRRIRRVQSITGEMPDGGLTHSWLLTSRLPPRTPVFNRRAAEETGATCRRPARPPPAQPGTMSRGRPSIIDGVKCERRNKERFPRSTWPRDVFTSPKGDFFRIAMKQ